MTDEETIKSIKKAIKGKWYSEFEFKGMSIKNPLVNESMMQNVDPVDYYGIANIDKFLGRFGARL